MTLQLTWLSKGCILGPEWGCGVANFWNSCCCSVCTGVYLVSVLFSQSSSTAVELATSLGCSATLLRSEILWRWGCGFSARTALSEVKDLTCSATLQPEQSMSPWLSLLAVTEDQQEMNRHYIIQHIPSQTTVRAHDGTIIMQSTNPLWVMMFLKWCGFALQSFSLFSNIFTE